MLNQRYVEIYNLVKAYPNPFGAEVKVVDGFELIVPQEKWSRLLGTLAVVSPLF